MSSGLAINSKHPTDVRDIVEYKNQLLTLNVPQGFITTVLHDANENATGASTTSGAVYWLKGTNSREAADWEKVTTITDPELLTTGLEFRGSFENAQAINTAIPSPSNGYFVFNQDDSKFYIYSETDSNWIEYFALSDLNINVNEAKSLDIDLTYNGILIPTAPQNGNSTFDLNNTITVTSSAVYNDETSHIEVDLPSSFVIGSNGYCLDNTIVNVRFDVDFEDFSDPVEGIEVSCGQDNGAPVYETIVDYYGEPFVNFVKGQVIQIIFVNDESSCQWRVVDPTLLQKEFYFSKTLKDYDWSILLNTCNNVEMQDFDNVYSDLIKITTQENAFTFGKASHIHFLTIGGQRYKFNATKKANDDIVVSFIAKNYYYEATISKNTVDNKYYVTCNPRNIIADETVDLNDVNVTPNDARAVTVSSVKAKFATIDNLLTWNDLDSNN